MTKSEIIKRLQKALDDAYKKGENIKEFRYAYMYGYLESHIKEIIEALEEDI
jgi:hypothetical protein